jgi:signal transduction histidine kinase/FixJ family two-component response regulator
MTRVATIVEPISPVTAETTGGEIYKRFEAEPDTLAIAVVDSARAPIGLIERGQFMLKMGSAHGRPLYGGRSVSLVMDSDPLLVDQNTLISEFTGDALAQRPSDLLRGFVVVDQGRYVGVGSALSLLQAANDQSRRQAAELTELNRAAARDQSRWSMLFHQSPLPQLCFDASRLYRALHAGHDEPAPLGSRMRDGYATLRRIFRHIALREANEAARRLFGVENFHGLVDFKHFDAISLAGIFEAANGINADGAFPPIEARINRADGCPVDVRVHVRTLAGGESPWGVCMATFVDMTEVQRAARAQREATMAAEAANRAKTEFLATMSHEIRTPLNGVLGMAQVMENDDLSPTQRSRIDIIRMSGESLLTILNDILDLSKIEAGKLDLETVEFDLEDLVRGACAPFVVAARGKGLAFDVEIDPQAKGGYLGDPVRVRQIVSNLLSNAVKFTDSGGLRLTVATTASGLRLTVSDTGAGIAADRIAKIFEKFVQADSSTTRRFGGTGLGLAIIRKIAEAMGGAISAESVLGEGSSFIVDLPLARCASADEAGGPAPAPEPGPRDVAERELRILAAEDNAINQLVLRTLLEQFGIHPEIVESGLDAVEMWEQNNWDLILMDVQMPVMDGPTATRHIRARERELGRGRTPIIALTANAMSHQIDEYSAAGMDGFVAKPIEIARLYDVINSIVQAAGPDVSAEEALDHAAA